MHEKDSVMDRAVLVEELQDKFMALDQTLWEKRAQWPHVQKWLSQFEQVETMEDDEQLQMLFLASHFMYFGIIQVPALLRSLFRDLYQYKAIEQIRRQNGDTKDRVFIENQFREMLAATRFLGVGNPAESGSHLLYYFRQENRLGRSYFINSHEILSRVISGAIVQSKLRDDNVSRYVFIDDLCGSGTQAAAYTEDLVRPIKQLNANARISYYTLFATSFGLGEVKKLGSFDDVATVVELDESFRCFSANSRIYI